MNIVITSGQILAFIAVCTVFLIGAIMGYFIGRYDGKLIKQKKGGVNMTEIDFNKDIDECRETE